MTCWFGIKAYVGLNKTFFFVPQKCVLPFHFAQSSVLAISNSRHDNVRASSTLFIWLNENVEIVVWNCANHIAVVYALFPFVEQTI